MTPPPLGAPPSHIKITPFAECEMSPRGVWSMVHHLRDHPLLRQQPEERLRAMAVAFLAFGGTTDGKHAVPTGELHPSHIVAHLSKNHFTWRNSMRELYTNMVMDILTWLDRLSGGATVLVHTPGTRPPGTHASTEEVKLEVFLPIVLLHENPALEPVFARIVQYLAEQVGFPVMQRWDHAKELHTGGARNNPGTPRHPSNRGANQPLIPASATPYRVFYGRAPGALEALIASLPGTLAPPLIPPGLVPTPSSAAPAPASALLPAAPASASGSTPAGSSAPRTTVSSPAKPHIKAEYREGDVWSHEDVIAGAENMESEMTQPPDAPFGYAPRLPFLGRRQHPQSVITELEARIKYLEDLISEQGQELDRLYEMLEVENPTRSQRPPAAHTPRGSGSPDTFGRGKAVARREQSPSNQSISSVSSVSASPPPSRYAGSRASTPGGPWVMAVAPQASVASSTSRSPPPSGASASSHRSRRPQATVVYGPRTDSCAQSLGYRPSVCEALRGVRDQYSSDKWYEAIFRVVPGCSERDVVNLYQAMLQDRDSASN